MNLHWDKIYWLYLLFAVVCSVLLAAKRTSCATSMKAETFFDGAQLQAYQLAQKGNLENLLQLTKAGVDLNKPGKDDMTMLGLAVLTADRRAIISLIHAGADPNQRIPDVGSPAVLAISHHFAPPHTEALSALFDAGYDPNQVLEYGTPYLFKFVDFNHWPGLKLAIQRGGNINARRKNGESLLTYLIEGGDDKQARKLIAMGADVSARGERGESALEAIESRIRRANPSIRKAWKDMLSMRELILSKLPDEKDRRSAFTEKVEMKIRQNP